MIYAACIFVLLNAVTIGWCAWHIVRLVREANEIIEGEEADAE